MSWAALLTLFKILFEGLLKGLLGLFKAVADWLLAHPTFAVALLLTMHVGLHAVVIDPRLHDQLRLQRARADGAEAAAANWRKAHTKLMADVARVQQDAAELDRRNAARVEREQAVVIERTAHDYEMRLAERDAAVVQLRDRIDLAGTASGAGGGRTADVPADLAARCRAFGAADCDALLAQLPNLLSEAEGNTAQLIALQDYVRGLLGIDFTNLEVRPNP